MITFRFLLQSIVALFAADASVTLRDLDARTLADIGVDRSEIESIEAEWLGRAEATRLHIAAGPHHA